MDNETTRIPNVSPEVLDPSAYKYDMDYHRFSSFLGVNPLDRGDKRLAEKTAMIYDWAKLQAKSEEPVAIYDAVRQLIRSLGSQNKGSELVSQLHRWVRIDMDGVRAKEQLKARADAISSELRAQEAKRLEAREKRNKFIEKQEMERKKSEEINAKAEQSRKDAFKRHKAENRPVVHEKPVDATQDSKYFEPQPIE